MAISQGMLVVMMVLTAAHAEEDECQGNSMLAQLQRTKTKMGNPVVPLDDMQAQLDQLNDQIRNGQSDAAALLQQEDAQLPQEAMTEMMMDNEFRPPQTAEIDAARAEAELNPDDVKAAPPTSDTSYAPPKPQPAKTEAGPGSAVANPIPALTEALGGYDVAENPPPPVKREVAQEAGAQDKNSLFNTLADKAETVNQLENALNNPDISPIDSTAAADKAQEIIGTGKDKDDPAQAAASFTASTPAALKTLAAAMLQASRKQEYSAQNMMQTKDLLEKAIIRAKTRKVLAIDAKKRQNYASDVGSQASNLAAEASIAQQAANKATAAANDARLAMNQRQEELDAKRSVANRLNREMRKAVVEYEAAYDKAKELKEIAKQEDQKATDARLAKTAAETAHATAVHEKQLILEELKKKVRLCAEDKAFWQAALSMYDKDTAAASVAQKEETDLTTNLGSQTAVTAQTIVRETEATKNMGHSSQVWEQNEELARQLEAKAQAERTKAETMVNEVHELMKKAKAEGDQVPQVGHPDWIPVNA